MERIIEKKITVTDENVTDIMESALQGITYWAGEAHIMGLKDKDEGMWTSEAITKGYHVRIWDSEEEKWRQLTFTKFLKGLKMMDNLDIESYDMVDADMIIQFALFGKQVYA